MNYDTDETRNASTVHMPSLRRGPARLCAAPALAPVSSRRVTGVQQCTCLSVPSAALPPKPRRNCRGRPLRAFQHLVWVRRVAGSTPSFPAEAVLPGCLKSEYTYNAETRMTQCCYGAPCCLSGKAVRGLLISLIFSKNLLLLSLIFLHWFPLFNCIDFCSNFYYFFLLPTLNLICCFSLVLRK